MSNVTNRQWPHAQSPAGWPTTTNAAQPTTQPYPAVRMPTVPPAAAEILRDAVWHIDADEHQASGANLKTVRNLGWGGSPLNARSGSTTVADTNDPLFLPYCGTPYMYLSTSSGSLATPSTAPLQVVGDMDIRMQLCPAVSWRNSTGALLAKGATTSYALHHTYYDTNGQLEFDWYTAGVRKSIRTSVPASNNLGIAPTTAWVRATLDVDNGAGGWTVTFYTSPDGAAWTQLGTPITGSGVTSIDATASSVQVAADSASIYRAQIWNGIEGQGGTLVFDADTSALTSGSQTTFTERSSNGATVTINRATSGRKSVAVVAPVWLFGTDDFMSVPGSASASKLLDFGALDSFTIIMFSRFWTASSTIYMLSKTDSTAGSMLGYLMFLSGGALSDRIGDGANRSLTTGTAPSPGASWLNTMIRKADTKKVIGYNGANGGPEMGSTTSTGTQSLTNVYTLKIGQLLMAYADMEFMSAAIFRRVLSAAEIVTLTDYYQGKYA